MAFCAGWRNFIREVTCCLLIASPAPLILRPLSSLRKQSYKTRQHPQATSQRIKESGHLITLSSHGPTAEFLTVRDGAYSPMNKVEIYPMYFAARPRPSLNSLRPIPGMGGSATELLKPRVAAMDRRPARTTLINFPCLTNHTEKKLIKAVDQVPHQEKRPQSGHLRAVPGTLGQPQASHPKVRGLLQRRNIHKVYATIPRR